MANIKEAPYGVLVTGAVLTLAVATVGLVLYQAQEPSREVANQKSPNTVLLEQAEARNDLTQDPSITQYVSKDGTIHSCVQINDTFFDEHYDSTLPRVKTGNEALTFLGAVIADNVEYLLIQGDQEIPVSGANNFPLMANGSEVCVEESPIEKGTNP